MGEKIEKDHLILSILMLKKICDSPLIMAIRNVSFNLRLNEMLAKAFL